MLGTGVATGVGCAANYGLHSTLLSAGLTTGAAGVLLNPPAVAGAVVGFVVTNTNWVTSAMSYVVPWWTQRTVAPFWRALNKVDDFSLNTAGPDMRV